MEHQAALEARDQLSRGPGAHDHGPGVGEPFERARVGGVDAGVAVGGGEGGDQIGVPARGRPPVDRRDLGVLGAERVGHQVEAGGGDP